MKGAAAVQGIAPLKHHVNQSARPEWPVNLYPGTEILRRQEVIELLFSAFAILRASELVAHVLGRDLISLDRAISNMEKAAVEPCGRPRN
jgi:hypothetical protein